MKSQSLLKNFFSPSIQFRQTASKLRDRRTHQDGLHRSSGIGARIQDGLHRSSGTGARIIFIEKRRSFPPSLQNALHFAISQSDLQCFSHEDGCFAPETESISSPADIEHDTRDRAGHTATHSKTSPAAIEYDTRDRAGHTANTLYFMPDITEL